MQCSLNHQTLNNMYYFQIHLYIGQVHSNPKRLLQGYGRKCITINARTHYDRTEYNGGGGGGGGGGALLRFKLSIYLSVCQPSTQQSIHSSVRPSIRPSVPSIHPASQPSIQIPVYKKGENMLLLTLVSLTCICCKTFAHILVSNINTHLAFESILADCQHGFRSQRSCKIRLPQFFCMPHWNSLHFSVVDIGHRHSRRVQSSNLDSLRKHAYSNILRFLPTKTFR